MTREDVFSAAGLAQEILQDDTPYLTAKSLISSVFMRQIAEQIRDAIMLRLTVIDSYYGTNMSKRYYGIDDIADALTDVGNTDDALRRCFLSFLRQCKNGVEKENPVECLLNARYGVTKTATTSKRAISLLSKYAYFLCQYEFPIYDRLALDTCQLLARYCADLSLPTVRLNEPSAFFREMSRLGDDFSSFDVLDNLLWLTGKVREGNLSLVLSRKRFVALRGVIQLPMTYEGISHAASSNPQFCEVIGQKLSRFINFVKTIA